MSAYRVKYRGPAELAVGAATLLADADGIDLVASDPLEPTGTGDVVALTVTVEGTRAAVDAAVRRLREQLPADASLTVDGP